MKLGVISDIHGNKPALDVVLDRLNEHGVDGIVCAGDIVGVFGSSNEVVTTIRERVGASVYGNHDTRFFSGRCFTPERDVEKEEYRQVMSSLSKSNYEWLTSLPGIENVHENVILAHCRPNPVDPAGGRRGDGGITPRKFVSVGAEHVDGDVLILGHTHHQHAVNKFFDGLVVNPGSVGESLDGKAECAIVDTESFDYELLHVEYDAEPVNSLVVKAGLKD